MENVITNITNWIKDYFVNNGPDCKAIIGISGGKDSTVTAALLVKALGKNRVIGVKMPQGNQHDIDVANKVIDYLDIDSYEVRQIGKALGIPNEFIFKTPEDGLSGKTDEDNLGFTYDELDNFLLRGDYPSYDVYKNIEERHKRNLHKVKPMPSCPRYYSTRDWEV